MARLQLTLQQAGDLLDRAVQQHCKVLLLGPPGVGKTTLARHAAGRNGRTITVLDGGNEASWKRLMPYKTPSGEIELGLAKTAEGNVLVIDEVTRAQSEAKSLFQTLAGANGHCLVTWPDGHAEEISLTIVATANTEGVGVEEMSAAEIDRYDFVVWVSPTDEEVVGILADAYGQPPARGAILWKVCKDLAGKLDKTKFHRPEGLRFAIALAKGLSVMDGLMPAAAVFKMAAERCFPHGRRGSERHASEFESLVSSQATLFERDLGGAPVATAASTPVPVAVRAYSINDLAREALPELVTAEAALPFALSDPRTVSALHQAFGLGCVKAVLSVIGRTVKPQVTHRTVTVDRARGSITFNGTVRASVQTFARALLAR